MDIAVAEEDIQTPQRNEPESVRELEEVYDCCEECGPNEIFAEEGHKYCKHCGYDYGDELEMNAEFRWFPDDKGTNNNRVGMPINPLLPQSSLGTIIMVKYKHDPIMRKIRKYHNWNSMPYEERSQNGVFERLNRIGVRYNLPSVIIHNSKELWKLLSEYYRTKGAKRQGVIAACMYFAMKENNVSRTSKEVAEMFGIPTCVMTMGIKNFQGVMSRVKRDEGSRDITDACSKPEDFIPRFCGNIGITNQTFIAICNKIAERCRVLGIGTEGTPPSIAVSIIYLTTIALKRNIEFRDISEKCNISQVTIVKGAKVIHTHRHRIFPDTLAKRLPDTI
jgi:transcription initiation factor TFIIB